MKFILSGLAAFAVLLLFSCHARQQAVLIIYNAKIYTVDSAFSVAQALAVKDGKILATGSDDVIKEAYEAPEVIDMGGQYIYPGFIDAHSHFVEYGETFFWAPLFGCTGVEEMVQRVKVFADAHPGLGWIRGSGWDQNKFPGKGFPDNTMLNEVFPSTPVVLTRVDGHAVLANAKALELAGIRPGQTIVGGTIERGAS
jgi:predicted amidohydrolase YtcJ